MARISLCLVCENTLEDVDLWTILHTQTAVTSMKAKPVLITELRCSVILVCTGLTPGYVKIDFVLSVLRRSQEELSADIAS